MAAVITSMVSVFGGMATYEPLRQVAVFHTQGGAVSWWPLLVYGPWLVAALSILRAALHRCRAAHSWVVVLLFSSVAVLLCVLQAGGSITGAAAASPRPQNDLPNMLSDTSSRVSISAADAPPSSSRR